MSGLYIHAPFCKQKCTYCDFASFPKELGKAESYFACLYREIEGRSKQYPKTILDTIYIGGGTPSVVDSKFIVGAIRQVKKCFTVKKDAEITIELNPGTVDEKKIKDYLSVGINRFSIGLQTGFDDQLKKLNRIHTAKDFLLLTNMLKGQNISADILIGLSGQNIDQVKKSIDLALAGGVSHLSVYALTPEVGTPIYTDYLNGELPDSDEVAQLYEFGYKLLEEKGYQRYEVSNFAKPGFESRHNLNYWKRGEYIGVGVSASSFMQGKRFTNTFDLDEYMKCIISGFYPAITSEEVEEKDAKFEYVMLALRTKYGVNMQEYKAKFGTSLGDDFPQALKKTVKFLELEGDNLRIKPEHLYVQNSILMYFLEEERE